MHMVDFHDSVLNFSVGSDVLASKSNNKIEILSVFAKAAYNVHGDLIKTVLVANMRVNRSICPIFKTLF